MLPLTPWSRKNLGEPEGGSSRRSARVGPEGIEPPSHRLKGECVAVTPRPRLQSRLAFQEDEHGTGSRGTSMYSRHHQGRWSPQKVRVLSIDFFCQDRHGRAPGIPPIANRMFENVGGKRFADTHAVIPYQGSDPPPSNRGRVVPAASSGRGCYCSCNQPLAEHRPRSASGRRLGCCRSPRLD